MHRGRRAAHGAPPPLSPRRGPAVPLRRTTAIRAFDRLHDTPLPEGFNVPGKGYPSGGMMVARTRFLSECLNTADEFKRTRKRHRPALTPLNATRFLSYKPTFSRIHRFSNPSFNQWKSANKRRVDANRPPFESSSD